MWGTEPDGTGRHGVRVAGVEAPHGVAESAGVPGVSGEATEPGRAGVARQAAGASGGQSDRGAGNGAGRAGGPIGGDGARSGRDPAPAGSEAGAATAVPGAGGALPLSGPPGAVRGASALSGLHVGAGGHGGGLRAVFERGLADCGARPLDWMGGGERASWCTWSRTVAI